jgi:nicotinamidase-related amidase
MAGLQEKNAMRHEHTLELRRTALVVVDMQEAFRASIADFTEVSARIALAVRAAGLLEVPVVVTEQYPKGLGPTAEEIRAVLPADHVPIEKTAFSSCGARGFVERLRGLDARHILVCGIEAHICVNQTTHDLLAHGYRVHLLTDCVTARAAENKQIALDKMRLAGALPSSVEMALFELIRDARHEQFKAIQKLIK